MNRSESESVVHLQVFYKIIIFVLPRIVNQDL